MGHIEEILALRREVLSGLEHPDIYVREADEVGFVSDHLGERGLTLGFFAGTRLVSYGMLGLPGTDDPGNLGFAIGFDAARRERVAHLASCMTLKDYRGKSIQRELVEARMRLAKSLGRRYCLAMVSLHNGMSRGNLFAAGLTIRWAGYLDELKRQLMFRDLDASIGFDERQEACVDPLDFERQCELTRAGWWGVGETGQAGRPLLVFRPRLADRDR